MVGKKVVAHGVYKKDKGLGVLTDLIMTVSERADLRQWSLLPRTIRIARINLVPGNYNFNLTGVDNFGAEKPICEFNSIVIKKNEKKILNCRGF